MAADPRWRSSRCAGVVALVHRGSSWAARIGQVLAGASRRASKAPYCGCHLRGPAAYNPPIDALWTRPYVPPPNWAPATQGPPICTIFMALTDLLAPQALGPSPTATPKKPAPHHLA